MQAFRMRVYIHDCSCPLPYVDKHQILRHFSAAETVIPLSCWPVVITQDKETRNACKHVHTGCWHEGHSIRNAGKHPMIQCHVPEELNLHCFLLLFSASSGGPGYCSQYSDSLDAGWCGN